jgi:hypothetical protein
MGDSFLGVRTPIFFISRYSPPYYFIFVGVVVGYISYHQSGPVPARPPVDFISGFFGVLFPPFGLSDAFTFDAFAVAFPPNTGMPVLTRSTLVPVWCDSVSHITILSHHT